MMKASGDNSGPYASQLIGDEIDRLDGGHLQECNLANDILRGAGAIAEHLYGDRRHRRTIYHLAQTKRLPIFHLGSTICARRSTLIAWIEDQEKLATKPKG